MKFLARDGKIFDNEGACLGHEARLDKIDKDKKDAFDKLHELRDEYCAARDRYLEARRDYVSTYVDDEATITASIDFESFIKLVKSTLGGGTTRCM